MEEHRPQKLLDQVRDAIPLKHYSYRTEQAYVGWIKRYISSTVQIAHLTTDRDVYRQGDAVAVDIALDNSGSTQNVIVHALVKRYGSNEVVDGLLLTSSTVL